MFDDEIDLSDAELFADNNRGVYIPQYFAQAIIRQYAQGVSDGDYAILEAGPDHEGYWDTWANVCDNATITTPQGKRFYLYQDGDLWLVPYAKP